eukprot:1266986-Amphidinium_carterae.1
MWMLTCKTTKMRNRTIGLQTLGGLHAHCDCQVPHGCGIVDAQIATNLSAPCIHNNSALHCIVERMHVTLERFFLFIAQLNLQMHVRQSQGRNGKMCAKITTACTFDVPTLRYCAK